MFESFVRAVFPLRCPGCGAAGKPVCDRCAATLQPAASARPPAGVDQWAAVFAYDGVAREVIARAKYRGAHAVFGWLADAMARLVAPPVPPLVTWVPTTSLRQRERGFDHAELLAREVAHRIARPARRVLTRTGGAPQTGLSAAARRVGPTVAAARCPVPCVLLIDDVATTGASLSACATALRTAGVSRVVALTAARTPAPIA